MSQWTVWLPGRWPGYNEFHQGKGNRHWAAVARLKRSWQDTAGLLIKAAKVPHVERCELHYLHRRKDRRHDRSNLAFGASKIIEDALQDVGVLDDDGWNYVVGFQHAFEVDPREGVLLTIRAA